jgi:MFS family permease
VFVVLLLRLAVTSFFDAISVVAGDSVIQLRTPDRLRGRTFAGIRGLGWVANAIAFSIAGFLVEWLGFRGVYGVGAIAGLIYGLILVLLGGSDLGESLAVGSRRAVHVTDITHHALANRWRSQTYKGGATASQEVHPRTGGRSRRPADALCRPAFPPTRIVLGTSDRRDSRITFLVRDWHARSRQRNRTLVHPSVLSLAAQTSRILLP